MTTCIAAWAFFPACRRRAAEKRKARGVHRQTCSTNWKADLQEQRVRGLLQVLHDALGQPSGMDGAHDMATGVSRHQSSEDSQRKGLGELHQAQNASLQGRLRKRCLWYVPQGEMRSLRCCSSPPRLVPAAG